MARQKTIEFAESALADLDDIRDWYAEQGVAGVGVRLIGEVFVQVERLATFPESGRIVPEFELPAVREILHPPFRIIYRLSDTQVWVVRVWRNERLLKMPVD